MRKISFEKRKKNIIVLVEYKDAAGFIGYIDF